MVNMKTVKHRGQIIAFYNKDSIPRGLIINEWIKMLCHRFDEYYK